MFFFVLFFTRSLTGRVTQARIQRGDLGIYPPPPPPPLNFLEVKIIKNVKLNGNKRLALKFSQEIQTETRISNINLKKTEKKKRFALKFSHEIRTETRISNFNLKGGFDLQYLRLGDIWGGYLFRIIYLRGGGLGVLHYTPKT